MTKEKTGFSPESLMTTAGYKPELSQGAAKCPIFPSSTYVFQGAQEGENFFAVAYGLRPPNPGEETGLIYGRINHPGLQIAEERLTLWENGAETCAIFSSGLAAISTACLTFLKPNDLVLCSSPLYGGTDHFIKKWLSDYGIHSLFFNASQSKDEIITMVRESGLTGKLGLILIETPANPTNCLYEISAVKEVAEYFSNEHRKVLLAVDNTYMGPWQSPIEHGADLVLYSATKYIGGHSDLIAGACLGSTENINKMKVTRTFLGNMSDPFSCWEILRSLETYKVRMDAHASNAGKVAQYLPLHPLVENVRFIGNLTPTDGEQYRIAEKQCKTGGGMITFDIKGDKAAAFKFLDNLKLIKLAVSLGSTGSLIEHPFSMTHADVDPEFKLHLGITESTIRLSVGIENSDDIIADLEQALDAVETTE